MQRSVLANLECGRRPLVSVAEVRVLARALRVPPLLLMFPVGDEEITEVLPGIEVNTWDAAKWFTGEAPFAISRGERGTPLASDSAIHDGDAAIAWEEYNAVQLYREHDRQLRQIQAAHLRAGAAEGKAREATDEQGRASYFQTAEAERRLARAYEEMLGQCRATMRRQGLIPPHLTYPIPVV